MPVLHAFLIALDMALNDQMYKEPLKDYINHFNFLAENVSLTVLGVNIAFF